MQIRTLAASAAAVLILSLVMAADGYAQDPGTPDTLSVDSVVAYTSGTGTVPVRFYNDEDLGGIEVSLTVSSPDVQIDSFSFSGGRADYMSVKGTTVRTGSISIYCFPISSEPLVGPGSGLLGNLFLSWAVGISPQVATIDTITIVVTDVEYSTTFSTASSVAFAPQFRRGYVNILQSYGCCIGMRGNVDNDPGDNVNIADLTYLVAYLFKGGPPPDCPAEADIDGLNGPAPNVADLTWLVAYIFKGGPPPAQCS